VSASQVIAITDPRWSDDELVSRAERMLDIVEAGSLAIQLRDKHRGGAAVLALAERLRAVCSRYGAPFYINDRLDVALAVGADGAHLGNGSVDAEEARGLLGDTAFVSMSAHQLNDVDRAGRAGATAVLVSPIFATPGKGTPRGTEALRESKARAGKIRVYALGGVEIATAGDCVRAGADGVALVRALWGARDPASAARDLMEALRAHGA
jgi:thiamine-phosphate pyrophosphorylase